jgi:hypothetical protein
MTVPVRFNATFNFGEFQVHQHFGPASEIERSLLAMRSQFDCYRRHKTIVEPPCLERQVDGKTAPKLTQIFLLHGGVASI